MKNFKSKANKLSNETLVMLAMRVVETVNQSSVDAAKNAIYFVKLTIEIQKYMDTIGTNGEQQYSKEITLLFAKRKQLFDEIYVYLKGLSQSPDAEIRLAATALFEVVNRFGQNFSKLKIADQSLRYMRIIETLKRAEFVSALSTTLLTDKLTEIDNVQIEYEKLYMGRGNSQSTLKALSYIRQDIERTLKLFYDELNWAIRLNPTEDQITLRTIIEKRMIEIFHNKTSAKLAVENKENPEKPERIVLAS